MNLKSKKGIAVLETAGFLTILLTFIIGAFGVAEYMRASRILQATVDKYLYDSAVKPFSLNVEGNGIEVKVNEASMTQYIDDLALRMETELKDTLKKEENISPENLLIEAAYVELDVDTLNGKVKGLHKTPYSYFKALGNSTLTSKLNEKVVLVKEFENLSKADGLSNSNGEKVGRFATPSGLFTGEEGSLRFLPQAVLVGVRVGLALEDSSLAAFLNVIGVTPFTYEYKIVSLRGDVEE